MTMEQQVADAALALVHPSTDASHRTAASSFLEQWTRTPEAWMVYGNWLRSFSVDDSTPTTTGTRLLCLTLLLTKIRREVPRGSILEAESPVYIIQTQLWSLLQTKNDSSLVVPLCSCAAALAVRSKVLSTLHSVISTLPSSTSLRFLACVPSEAEACADLTTPQVTNELAPHVPVVLDTVQRALRSGNAAAAVPALDALCKWIETCHISLSHLNAPTTALLPLLVETLSHPHDESILCLAAKGLTEAALVPSDSCTHTRKDAVTILLNAVQVGFISALLMHSQNDDTAHALATAICTVVSEDVDDICIQKAPPGLLQLLFYIQDHPKESVTFCVLECWLTIQDVSTLERHEDWKQPLFTRVLNGLITRVAYPASFTNWQHDHEVMDQDEFTQLRMFVSDIYVSCYFLLRVGMIHQIVVFLQNDDWNVNESALACLASVSREVCARIKSNRPQTKADRDETVKQLGNLVKGLQERQALIRNQPILFSTTVRFIGSYAPVWNKYCSAEFLMQLLALTRAAMSEPQAVKDAAHATRALYIGCTDKLLECLDHNDGRPLLLACLTESMEAIVTAPNCDASCVAEVAEGTTRLVVSIKDNDTLLRQTLGHLVSPLMQRAQHAATALTTQPAHTEVAHEQILHSLLALTNIVKFCDVPIHDVDVHPLADVLPVLLRFLKSLVDTTLEDEDIVKHVLLLHLQLLRTAPTLIWPHFGDILQMVVGIFDRTMHYTALEYIGGGVEAFSPLDQESIVSFGQLLGHVTRVVCTHFQSVAQPDDNVELIERFCDMNDRFILFCPNILFNCHDFPLIIALSVEGLTTGAAPACLNFLSHLFGWRELRLSSDVVAALEACSPKIDEKYVEYGERVTRVCVYGLLGGSQLLWAPMAECLIAIFSYVLPVEHDNRAQQWMYTAMSTAENQSLTPEECSNIIKILFGLVGKGKKSKPKARMLIIDFAKISKGELKSDALLTYLL